MLLKMFALGIAGHKGSYFDSGWNWLDFIIVILSYISFLPSVGNLTAFRTARVMPVAITKIARSSSRAKKRKSPDTTSHRGRRDGIGCRARS